ncbi:tetraacyldisaccharide 4'-kinase [Neptuniibacter sp. QD57_21]|uniref:tetraacyldisaccharide 4'-kinase n=1 Tax=Neptuniibacter sp. QD57_21 TaxID=3398213 RepID=UPI0039F4BAA9
MIRLEGRWYSEKPAPCVLKPFSALYRFLAKRKKDADLQQAWVAPVPVIIVGNISVGGTGKTPLTISLVERLKLEGYKPGIISRGYKSKATQFPFDVTTAGSPELAGDEPFMLAQRCQCPVIIDPNRPSAARYLLDNYECDLIISDDGLQHYRLDRDIEIVVIDGERGLGNRVLMPAGPLREEPDRLRSVDLIVSNGCLQSKIAEAATVEEMFLQPTALKNCLTDEELSLDALSGKQVHAVAGIGNPQRFFNTLEQELKVTVIPHAKPDHSFYTVEDFQFSDDYPVIMTEKDAVKVTEFAQSHCWYLQIKAQLAERFYAQLLDKLKIAIANKGKTQNG